MITPIESEKELLDIGYGLKIGLKNKSTWEVQAKYGCFDLKDTADFFRVMVLLEKPYREVKALIEHFMHEQHVDVEFDIWRIVGAGLMCRSDQWASLALKWMPELSVDEKDLLRDLLLQVHGAKWASQKTRQLADQYTRQSRLQE